MKGIVIATVFVREFSWISSVLYVHLQPNSLVSHIRIHWDGLSRSIRVISDPSELKKPYTNLTQNRLSDLTILWEQLDISKKKRFCKAYCDIVSLISVPTEEPLLRAVMRFWDPSYKCFTFGKNDLVPIVKEYSVLIGVELQHPDKVYNQKSRAGWRKALAQILKVQPQTIDTYLI